MPGGGDAYTAAEDAADAVGVSFFVTILTLRRPCAR